MRIGYDAKRAFKNFTGLGNYSRAVISIMADYYPNNEYFLYTPPYKSNVLHETSNITICQPKGIWRIFHSIWRSFKLVSEIKKNKIEIFHGLSHELPVGIESSGVKSVVTMHDLIVLRYPHLYKAIDRKIYMKKYRAACKNSDLIIAISKQTKTDLINLMGVDEKKIRLVYQGCDSQFYKKCEEFEKSAVKQKYNLPDKFILNVGTIEPRKSLITIIRSLSNLPKNIKLVAVGKSTDYMKEVLAEIERLHLHNRVCFLHNVKFEDLPAIYQLAQIFVYPSIFEGFGIPILEALNSQTPVVAVNSSSLPEVGGDAAIYIEPNDHIALSNNISCILNSDDIKKNMIAKGIIQAAKFREEKVADSLYAVYDELYKL